MDKISGDQLAEAIAPLLELLDLQPAETFHVVAGSREVQAYYFLTNADGNRYIDPDTNEPAMSRRVLHVGF